LQAPKLHAIMCRIQLYACINKYFDIFVKKYKIDVYKIYYIYTNILNIKFVLIQLIKEASILSA